MSDQPWTQGTAVVVGGSMAGLLAARVLAEQFAQVIIVERDILPATPEHRRGVPQAKHAHGLLGHGRQILEELFPGFEQELLERGVVRGQGRFYSGGGRHARVVDQQGRLFVSRPLLEFCVRGRVRALPNVTIIENSDVLGLATIGQPPQVVGARVRAREEGALERVLEAGLVVDATGRGSRAPAWLAALGYPEPEEEVVEVDMGYSTRIYRREPGLLDGDLLVNVAPSPGTRRGSAMLAMEDDRWMVTIAGYFGDDPPVDEPGFLEFARGLPAPEIYDTIRTATPLTDTATYRFRANEWRHYERLERFPEGFLVIGDAICNFTPIYGQGMTVAALEALALRECLAKGPEQLATRFFARAAKVIAIPWSITVGNDRRLSPTTPTPKAPLRAINWYVGKLHVAARTDARVAEAFLRVGNLFDPPSALLRPGIAVRVLLGNLRGSRGEPASVVRHELDREPLQS